MRIYGKKGNCKNESDLEENKVNPKIDSCFQKENGQNTEDSRQGKKKSK